jgi:phosphoglycerate dehydrogenase-like enzyme
MNYAKQTHKTLFLTDRAPLHQKLALEAAPDCLDIKVLMSAKQDVIIRELGDTVFLISEREGTIDRRMLESAPSLKMVVRLGSRTWDIDTTAAARLGIRVCKVPLDSCTHVAEHVIMQALALSRKVRECMIVMNETDWTKQPVQCAEETFAYNWSDRTGLRLLKDSVFGILGFGEIGTEVAIRLKSFGCRVLYNKRKRLPPEAEEYLGVEYCDQEQIAEHADFVCSLLPYFDESGQTIDAAFFSRMKKGACFMHCGGSGVVAESALMAALQSGRLAGAALDAFGWEPVRKDEPLLELSRDFRVNLILTPHVAAGGTSIDKANSRRAYYENIIALLESRPLRNVVV